MRILRPDGSSARKPGIPSGDDVYEAVIPDEGPVGLRIEQRTAHGKNVIVVNAVTPGGQSASSRPKSPGDGGGGAVATQAVMMRAQGRRWPAARPCGSPRHQTPSSHSFRTGIRSLRIPVRPWPRAWAPMTQNPKYH